MVHVGALHTAIASATVWKYKYIQDVRCEWIAVFHRGFVATDSHMWSTDPESKGAATNNYGHVKVTHAAKIMPL